MPADVLMPAPVCAKSEPCQRTSACSAPTMTTMRRARPFFICSATASKVRLFRVSGGVLSSIMRDSSFPILACRPTLPLFWFLSRHFFPCCGCPRCPLCLRPIVDVGYLGVWRSRVERKKEKIAGAVPPVGVHESHVELALFKMRHCQDHHAPTTVPTHVQST